MSVYLKFCGMFLNPFTPKSDKHKLSLQFYYAVVCFTVLCRTALNCTVLYDLLMSESVTFYRALYCTILKDTTLHCSKLFALIRNFEMYHTFLSCNTLHYSCTAMHYCTLVYSLKYIYVITESRPLKHCGIYVE